MELKTGEIIGEINKLDINSKRGITSLLVLIPFWYLSLYLLKRPFFDHSDISLRLVFAFCFSIGWYFAHTALSIATDLIIYDTYEKHQKTEEHLRDAGFMSIINLCFVLVYAYKERWNFNNFLMLSYIYILISAAISCTGRYITNKKRNKKIAAGL